MMHRIGIEFAVSLTISLFSVVLGWAALAQVAAKAVSRPSSETAPLYRINFKPGDPVPGIGAMPAVRLPFECTSDGTVFISMVQALGAGSPPHNLSPYSPSLLLTSVSPSNEAHSFPLNQVPDLYDVQEIGDYASESRVIFLVRATREDKQGSDGTPGEGIRNTAEHHFYIVIFDRDGNYQKTVQIEDVFRLNQIGLFPSGTFLAYGVDQIDHAPKLALLKEDGRFLKFIEIPKGDAPESGLGTKDPGGKGPQAYAAPVQFVGGGQFIYAVQNKTTFPLLEVTEAGAIRAIHPRLPEGIQINMLIPSDANLYARVSEIREGSIYEISPQDGAVLRRFQVADDESGADVACVHEGKFLSFEHGEGKLIPLVGTAEPASNGLPADQRQQAPPEKASPKTENQ